MVRDWQQHLLWLTSVAGLGEFRIRDLNDEINKLMGTKRFWEQRITQLGGPDYRVRIRVFTATSLTRYSELAQG